MQVEWRRAGVRRFPAAYPILSRGGEYCRAADLRRFRVGAYCRAADLRRFRVGEYCRAADHRRYRVGAYCRAADHRRFRVGAYCRAAYPDDPEVGDSRVADSSWVAVARVSVGCRSGAVADSRAEDCDSRKRIATECFDKLRRDRPIPNSNPAIPRADR